MKRGTLFVKVDGEFVPVANCTVDTLDGGVFTTHETDRSRPKNSTITWHRVGTLPKAVFDPHDGAMPA
jgi:hypothetical protein